MLRLRPYKKCDAYYIVKWIKDEVSFRKWCADRYESYPISDIDLNNHYEELAFSDSFFPMTAYDETGVVGHLIMRFTDDEKQTLRFGYIIVDDSKRGRGYGREMLEISLQYAFEILKVKRVTIGVFENNESAYRCYKAVGFRDVALEEKECYHMFGEEWNRLELEMER